MRITLRERDGQIHERTFEFLPPALLTEGEIVTVLANETLNVEATPAGDAVRPERVVARAEHPERTISFQFEQMEGRPDMMLKVTNPFDRPLKYELQMSVPDRKELLYTTSCPVRPGKIVFEHWPHPIFQLIVTHLRFLARNADLACE